MLDTTVLIDVLRNRNQRRASLATIVEQDHILAISALNLGEVYAGMRPEEAPQTEVFLGSLECLPVTAAIARRAGSLKFAWQLKGRTLTLADMIVAATALEHSLPLVTDNRRDFPLTELTFYALP
ncbi:MAG TPA: type II toxin-antitoxin system VapC family toxin [Acidobacteriaceae bacterium]|nr:type II toxin-antitoxin system VapC family toxin [Acidobacteriaceae bacterium]